MAKHRKGGESKINTEGWMMSYADMATILLAMFIVLSTLGKDQTGASLQRGLESWREMRQDFGLGNLFADSSRATQLGNTGPRYAVPGGGGPEEWQDPEGGAPQTLPAALDQEQERFQHLLSEIGRRFQVTTLPPARGQATVDCYEGLNSAAPYLKAGHKEKFRPLVPLLQREDYRVMVVVWATMAKESALQRAGAQARQVCDELAAAGGLDAAARRRLTAVGQPWAYPHFQRPVLSLVLTKSWPPRGGP